ncbi:MAG: DUF2157 domain-containing protein [Lentisphaerota bacterium]
MGNNERNKWLQEEVGDWVSGGLISAEQAVALRARYPVAQAQIAWGAILFSSIGAVIAGLGIILLFAFNWQAIPKFGKLALIFGSLILAHAAGIRLYVSNPRLRPLGEALCLLGTMLFGAGIWLVAQIYHIDEHFPNAFLIWGLGAGLMAWALPSIPQAMLSAVLLAVWGGCESVAFDVQMMASPLLIVVGLGSLAYLRKSRLLLAVVLPAFFVSLLFALIHEDQHPWVVFALLLNLAALLIALRHLAGRYGSFSGSAGVLGFYGWSVYLIMLYLMSFPSLCHEFFSWHQDKGPPIAQIIIPLVITAGAWGLALRQHWLDRTHPAPDRPGLDLYLVPLTVLLAFVDMFGLQGFDTGWVIAGPFNLVFLGLSGSMIMRGCSLGLLRPTVLGSVLFIALVVARYFDLFESLFVRGLVFVAVGVLLFLEGLLYSRQKKNRAGEGRVAT